MGAKIGYLGYDQYYIEAGAAGGWFPIAKPGWNDGYVSTLYGRYDGGNYRIYYGIGQTSVADPYFKLDANEYPIKVTLDNYGEGSFWTNMQAGTYGAGTGNFGIFTGDAA